MYRYLRQLRDVLFSSPPADGDTIVFDAALNKWKNSAAGNGGSSSLLVATKTLTASDLLALNGTAVEVVAAPGANKILMPVRACGIYVAGATPFTGGTTPTMGLGPGSAPAIGSYSWLQNTEIHDIFTQATDQVFFFADKVDTTNFMVGAGAWDAADEFEDLGLEVFLLGGGIGPDGDGICKLWVSYVIADLT